MSINSEALDLTGLAIRIDASALEIAGTAVTATAAELNAIAGNGLSAAELGVLDAVTPGTAAASKAVVLNSSKGIATITSATITTLTSTTVNTAAVVATAGINSSGATGAGIGYATGAGGAVTQITSRTTGVTLNKLSGTIQTDTSSLAAEGTADFIVTNSTVAIGDVVVVSIQSGSNSGGTIVSVAITTAGTFTIRVHNGNVAAGTAETGALIINFAVIKAVAA